MAATISTQLTAAQYLAGGLYIGDKNLLISIRVVAGRGDGGTYDQTSPDLERLRGERAAWRRARRADRHRPLCVGRNRHDRVAAMTRMKVTPQEAAKNFRENGGVVVCSLAASYIEEACAETALTRQVMRRYEDRCLKMAAAILGLVYGKRPDGSSVDLDTAKAEAAELITKPSWI